MLDEKEFDSELYRRLETENLPKIEVEFSSPIDISPLPAQELPQLPTKEVFLPGEKHFVEKSLELNEIPFIPKVPFPEKNELSQDWQSEEYEGPQLAPRVLFFVPGEEKGLMIYDQSPSGPEASFAGSLPEGKFHASGMEVVEFDPNKHAEEYRIVRERDGLYLQRVLIVDEQTFLKIALQGIYPEPVVGQEHYFVVDMHDEKRDVRKELIQTIYEEEQLEDSKRSIYLATVDTCDSILKDVVIGNNSKGKNNI